MADSSKIKLDPSDYLAPGEFSRMAVERFTHTPIKFTRLDSNTGEYPSYPPALNLYNKISQQFPSLGGPGVIKVDPYAADVQGGIPTTIQHEATHAVANNLPGIDEISSGAPRYDYLRSQLQNQIGGGPAAKEVLAYANSNDPSVNKDWMKEYIADITQKLQAAGLPSQAQVLDRIHKQGQP